MFISDDTPTVLGGSAKNPYTEEIGGGRGQVDCLVLGQNDGIASAVAAQSTIQVVNANVNRVQEELWRPGSTLEI